MLYSFSMKTCEFMEKMDHAGNSSKVKFKVEDDVQIGDQFDGIPLQQRFKTDHSSKETGSGRENGKPNLFRPVRQTVKTEEDDRNLQVPLVALSETLAERPGEPYCPYFLKTRMCKFGLKCKFDHPKDKIHSSTGDVKLVKPIVPFTSTLLHISNRLPMRPGKVDCSFYLKGSCKYGATCRFNHPERISLNPTVAPDLPPINPSLAPEEPGKVACSFYLKGSCKYGATCRFNHPERISLNPSVAPNLPPIDPSLAPEKLLARSSVVYTQGPRLIECDFYKNIGRCKFGENCRFYHSIDGHALTTSVAKQACANEELTLAGFPRREGASLNDTEFYTVGEAKYGNVHERSHTDRIPKINAAADQIDKSQVDSGSIKLHLEVASSCHCEGLTGDCNGHKVHANATFCSSQMTDPEVKDDIAQEKIDTATYNMLQCLPLSTFCIEVKEEYFQNDQASNLRDGTHVSGGPAVESFHVKNVNDVKLKTNELDHIPLQKHHGVLLTSCSSMRKSMETPRKMHITGHMEVASRGQSAYHMDDFTQQMAQNVKEDEMERCSEENIEGDHYEGYWEKHEAQRNDRSSNLCIDYLKGKCYRGSSCKYRHAPCKFLAAGNCHNGVSCRFSHENASHDKPEEKSQACAPCKYFAAGNCHRGVSCRFSHENAAHDIPEEKSPVSTDFRKRKTLGYSCHDISEPDAFKVLRTTSIGSPRSDVASPSCMEPRYSFKAIDFQESISLKSAISHEGQENSNRGSSPANFAQFGSPVEQESISADVSEMVDSALQTFLVEKNVETVENGLESPSKKAFDISNINDMVPVKSELGVSEESYNDGLEHMSDERGTVDANVNKMVVLALPAFLVEKNVETVENGLESSSKEAFHISNINNMVPAKNEFYNDELNHMSDQQELVSGNVNNIVSALPTFLVEKNVETGENGLESLSERALHIANINNMAPVKSEHGISEEFCSDELNHMLDERESVSGNVIKMVSSALLTSLVENVENGLESLSEKALHISNINNMVSVKSELGISEEFCNDELNRMLDERESVSGNVNKMVSSAMPTSLVEKNVETVENGLESPSKKALDILNIKNMLAVKSELGICEESSSDELDHMSLLERKKLIIARNISKIDIPRNSKRLRNTMPSAVSRNPTVSRTAVPEGINNRRKKRTATDSAVTALEEDAPGLLQVLVDKGIGADEIKLYGAVDDDDDLDYSLDEGSFSDLETVVSKLFSQRSSFLKFAPVRCKKGSKPSYCLACLVSLVEQARYLQLRKWPVEWGWCRDLQSFIFVFSRHNRIVLERPEYGYATYFFELVESLPIDWQIKRLVIAMKLSGCSRISLIENKSLMVGEDLTEGEAKVLEEYGWRPNSGLGSMLNYCDRVIHDRKKENNSEWKAKIGKLLMDGHDGGTIVLKHLPKKVIDYNQTRSSQMKLDI